MSSRCTLQLMDIIDESMEPFSHISHNRGMEQDEV